MSNGKTLNSFLFVCGVDPFLTESVRYVSWQIDHQQYGPTTIDQHEPSQGKFSLSEETLLEKGVNMPFTVSTISMLILVKQYTKKAKP